MANNVQHCNGHIVNRKCGVGYFTTDSLNVLFNIKENKYNIAGNFGGTKLWQIWRIEVQFAKVLSSKFYQSIFFF